eukprot:2433104-Rhodomonas_salina.1
MLKYREYWWTDRCEHATTGVQIRVGTPKIKYKKPQFQYKFVSRYRRIATDPAEARGTVSYSGTGLGAPYYTSVPGMPYTPKLIKRNRVCGTNCTEIVVSCSGFRGGARTPLPDVAVLRHASTGHALARSTMRYGGSGHGVHPEIQYKNPQFECNLYRKCGFLCLISGRRQRPVDTPRNQTRETAFLLTVVAEGAGVDAEGVTLREQA